MTASVPTPPDADGGLGEELRQFIVANRWFCLGEQRIASCLADLLARAHEKGRAEGADWATERAVRAIEGQVRHLRAVPSGAVSVSREAMAMDLENIAADLRIARDTQGGSDAEEAK